MQYACIITEDESPHSGGVVNQYINTEYLFYYDENNIRNYNCFYIKCLARARCYAECFNMCFPIYSST